MQHRGKLEYLMKREKGHIYLLLTTGVLLLAAGCTALKTSVTAPPHFRQVWWGSTKASVLTKEQGEQIHVNTGGSLVYKTQYGNVPVPVLLVYCFGSHNGIYRLRAAGYLTTIPREIGDPNNVFRQEMLETLGEPTETLEDGGILWHGNETVVYTNAHRAAERLSQWHLITGYIDRNFYDEISKSETWDAIPTELSHYEEFFFGMF